jgi:hypothetical protein
VNDKQTLESYKYELSRFRNSVEAITDILFKLSESKTHDNVVCMLEDAVIENYVNIRMIDLYHDDNTANDSILNKELKPVNKGKAHKEKDDYDWLSD